MTDRERKAAFELAMLFHEAYERLAPDFHYETRKESAKPWSDIPENNKNLMIAVCHELRAATVQSTSPYKDYTWEDVAMLVQENRALKEAATAQRCEWQPIETAPKNKILLLAYKNRAGNWRTVRGNWLDESTIVEWEDFDGNPVDYEGWYEVSENAEDPPNVWPINPTHWMPLPAAPVDKSAEQHSTKGETE